MPRNLKFAALAVMCLGLAAVPAYAARGGAGGGSKATISFAGTGFAALAAPTSGSSVSFAVTAPGVKPSDLNSLWVANVCSRDGVTVSAEYHPVQNWVAGPFTTSAAGTQCTAFVWVFPDAWTAVSGGSMSYAVS